MFKELKTTLRQSIPITIGQISHVMIGFADTAMIGVVGVVPVAAAGFGNSLFHIVMVFTFGISGVLSAFIGIAIGEKNRTEVGSLLRHGLLISLITGIGLYGVIEILIPFLGFFGQAPEVAAETAGYLRMIGLSLIPLSVMFAYRKFCEGVQSNIWPMWLVWLAVFLNIFLNWIFIFGHWGAPTMGLFGAGLATLLARVFLLGTFILHVHLDSRYQIYLADFRFRDFSPEILWRILRKGIPGGFQYLNEVGAFAFAAIMMGWLGAESLAAHQVAIQFPIITFMAVIGISSASSVRVAQAWGGQNFDQLKKVGYSAIAFVIVFMGSAGILFMLLRHQLPWLIIRDIEVVRLAAQLLVIGGLFQISDGVQGVALRLLSGLMDMTRPLAITIFSYWMVGIPISYYLGFRVGWNGVGIWVGLLAGLTLSALLLTLRFRQLAGRMRMEPLLELQAEE